MGPITWPLEVKTWGNAGATSMQNLSFTSPKQVIAQLIEGKDIVDRRGTKQGSRAYLKMVELAASMTGAVKKRIRFGPFEADLTTGEIWKSGVKLKLGGQPFKILATLLERPGELVTREELRQEIWPAETFVDFDHGLNAAVNKLRDTLGDSPEEPRYIETMPRRGYRFIGPLPEPPLSPAMAPLARAAGSPAPLVSLTTEDSLTSLARLDHGAIDTWPPPTQNRAPSPMPGKRRFFVYVLGLLAFVFLAGLYALVHLRSETIADFFGAKEHGKKLFREFVSIRTPGIWRLDLAHPKDPGARSMIVSGSGRNEGPQPSPDGKKLAFMSNRTGSLEIWTSNADGSNLAQLTNMGSCGSPQWSPDSRWIAFDSESRTTPGVYIVSAEGGPITTHLEINAETMVPRWARDGRWIYFASERSGEIQVWKVAIAGGKAVQVTHHGGFAATESYDGKTLYYAKTKFDNPEIWQMSVSGGPETPVSPLLRPTTWANWALTESGIFFLSRDANETYAIEFYDFATRGVRPVSTLDKASFWLAASRDARSAWYAQQEPDQIRATPSPDKE